MTCRERAKSIRRLDLSVPPGSVYASERRATLSDRRLIVQRLEVPPNVWKRGAW